MRIATVLAVATAIVTSIPLVGQNAGVSAGAQQSASATAAGASAGTHGAAGYGDEAASHSWEMSSITGELEGKLDSRTANPGQQVVLKTIQKVQTSDGTIIPKGSQLIGRITEVQAFSRGKAAAQIGIAFDQVQLKNGQTVAIYTLIRDLTPGAMAMSAMQSGSSFGSPMGGADADMSAPGTMGGGPTMTGGGIGGGRAGGVPGGAVNGVGGVAGGVNSAAGGTLDAAGPATGPVDDRVGEGLGSTQNSAVQIAGHGDQNLNTDAHAVAAARAVPRPTGIPGINLVGSATGSGLLLGSGQNIELQSGTRMQLGIVAK